MSHAGVFMEPGHAPGLVEVPGESRCIRHWTELCLSISRMVWLTTGCVQRHARQWSPEHENRRRSVGSCQLAAARTRLILPSQDCKPLHMSSSTHKSSRQGYALAADTSLSI